MVDKPKRKAAVGPAVRQSSRHAAPSSAPTEARNQPVEQYVKKFITIRLDSHRPSPADRARPLLGGLRNLLPNFKRYLSEDMCLPKNIKINDARRVLNDFTDSDHIKQLANAHQLDNKVFIAAVLDYAQEALGLPTETRASDVALVENVEDDTIDILTHKLNDIGLFPDRWPIPLNAAGMKRRNRPRSRFEEAPAVAAVKQEEVKKEEEPSPTENRNQNKKKKVTKAEEEGEEQEAGPSVRDSALHGGAGPSKYREQAPPPAAATTSNILDGKLTFRLGGGSKGFGSKKLQNLVNGLKIILPQASDKLDAAVNLPQHDAYESINRTLGRVVPQIDDGAISRPEEYYRNLIIWAVRAVEGTNGEEVALNSVVIDGFLGLELGKCRLPLHEESVRFASNRNAPYKLNAKANKRAPAPSAPPPSAAAPPAARPTGRGRGRNKKQEEVEEMIPTVLPVTGRKRGRQPRNPHPVASGIDTLLAAAAKEAAAAAEEEEAAAAAAKEAAIAAAIAAGRRVSGRNVGKPSLAVDISDEDEHYGDGYYSSESSTSEEEEEEERRHAAKRSRPSAPRPTAARSTGDTERGSLYELTTAQHQGCYWLRRTGQQALCFRAELRHNPPAPLHSSDLTSCHDCQSAHVRHPCSECSKSYCQACCRHYNYLFSAQPGDVLEPLLKEFNNGVCPCCLDICARKLCLRKRSKVYQNEPQVPELSKEEMKVMALHMARCLAGIQCHLAQVGENEARRQNTTLLDAHQLPAVSVEGYRLLCNRCATSMENAIVHCQCGADFCPQCCADLMENEKGPLQCPLCNQTTTSIQRVLSNKVINKLNSTQEVLDKTVARGGPAVTAYDYNCKLWRLPTAADRSAAKKNSGASGSKQQQQKQQSCMAPSVLMPPPPSHPPAAATNGAVPGPVFYGRTVVQQPNLLLGAPVLQGTLATTTTTGPLASLPAADLSAAARYQGVNAVSMQLLGKPVKNISPDQVEVVEKVFDRFLHGEYQIAPLARDALSKTIEKQAAEVISRLIPANGTLERPQQQQLLENGNGAGPSNAAAAVVGPNLVTLPTRAFTIIPNCIDLVNWHKDLPPEDYRLASNRPDGVQNYIWTPHVSDFSPSSPRRHETVQRFVQRWAAGEPIIIRGMRGRVNWGPTVVMRAARDMKKGLKDIAVTDCLDWGSEVEISAEQFFKMYTACHGPTHGTDDRELSMFKLKDFPPEDTFVNRCKRHNDDFLQMLNLCMPEYMHPKGGALNLASKLPDSAVPPDLGPKGYIAFGREKEHEGEEGDSVTRLHEDLSDAINILCHVQHPPDTKAPPKARCGDSPMKAPSCGGAGALWDLYRREDIDVLRKFILDVVAGKVRKCPPFCYKNKKLTLEDIKDPVHDQAIMLTASHRAAAALPPYNLQSWLIEQYEHEGVVIPAACAHQVRNLRSCIKIALDFVSPESVPLCLAQREERRVLAMAEVRERGGVLNSNEVIEDRHFHDKLQVVNMVVHGLTEALNVLDEGGEKTDKKARAANK